MMINEGPNLGTRQLHAKCLNFAKFAPDSLNWQSCIFMRWQYDGTLYVYASETSYRLHGANNCTDRPVVKSAWADWAWSQIQIHFSIIIWSNSDRGTAVVVVVFNLCCLLSKSNPTNPYPTPYFSHLKLYPTHFGKQQRRSEDVPCHISWELRA